MTQTLFPGQGFAAFLFDMDGTLLSSIAAAERVWTAWAQRHGLDVASFLPTIHGVRSVETIRRLALPGVDPEAEALAITRAEMADVEGVVPIQGAAGFLASIPPQRHAIVTSAPRALALRRLQAAGLAPPRLLIAAEDVTHGKPAPECFLLAAGRLGFPAANCLVFEDAPAGIAAADAAAAAVVVVTATHPHPIATRHVTIPDYRGLSVVIRPGGVLELHADE
ncbi:HAD-IA family hydrolase [Lichenicoccus sp.]|uniref:HAD-IA family hydrolase n=1 Tax=Lichenicoccus sp. TaxID=2781899 RepID=UPI003D0DFC47